MPTLLGRHGTALVHDPDARWRLDLTKAGVRDSPEPLLEGCACPACSKGFSRAYLGYLARAGELTGTRLITMHNLAFLARLMSDLRQGIVDEWLPEVAAQWRAGEFHPK
jgi:queuine tRNA-ribosyltransferase